MKKIPIIIFLSLICICSGQNVLFDDANNCHHLEVWDFLLDSLTHHGAMLHLVSDDGWECLPDMDMLWIECPTSSYSPATKAQIISFAESGGKIVIGDVANSININDLLLDPSWETTMKIINTATSGRVHSFLEFPPFTDGVDSLVLSSPRSIQTGENSFGFAFGDDYFTQPVAAISYPFKHEDNCSTFIILVMGTHSWETFASIVASNYRFATNILLCAAGIPGFELEGCEMPEGNIDVAFVDSCANPGDVVTIIGENLFPDIIIYIGSEEITPDFYASDSSEISFICPLLPQGTYSIFIERNGLRFPAGDIIIYCEHLSISAFGNGCYLAGDTAFFDAMNMELDAECFLISPDHDTLSCAYDIISEYLGFVIIPTEVESFDYNFYYITVRNPIGNYASFYAMIPCPCPDQAGQFRKAAGRHPADTKTPDIDADSPDSCIIIPNPSVIRWTTSADSFMANTDWPYRQPERPITIINVDGDTLAANWPNSSSPMEYPLFTDGDLAMDVIISATDYFGNTGADTVYSCFREDTIIMTGEAFADSCNADTVYFIVNHDNPIDESTICIMFAGGVYTYSDPEVEWLDDSTLIFITPEWAFDSLRGLYPVALSDIIRDNRGHRLVPDDGEEALAVSFRIPCCEDLYTFLYCPISDLSFISCDPFQPEFIIMDTTGFDQPDTSEIYFTMTINSTIIDPDYDIFGADDSFLVRINPEWSDTDSVLITLDSVFSINGCKTIP